jgi:polar amino acid transport system substrate-binding protein
MFPCRLLLIFSVCMFGFLTNGSAETTLIIVTDEHPPHVSKNPKESFLTEVLDEVAREMGVKFEFRFMPWKRCELSVEKLEAWGAVPYVRTLEREKKCYFSDSLYYYQSKFFYYNPAGKRKQIRYTELSDLKDYRIGAVKGYYYEQVFLKAGLNVEYVTAEEQNFKKLKEGRIDLIPADEVLGFYIIRKLYPPEDAGKFFTLSKQLNVSGNFLMTSKHYPDTQKLLARFNAALMKIKKNGVYQRILDKHGIKVTY